MNLFVLFETAEAATHEAAKKVVKPLTAIQKAKMELMRQRKAVVDTQGDLKSISPAPYKLHGEQQKIVQRVKTGNILGISPEKAMDMDREEMYGYKAYHNPNMKWYHTYGFKNTAKHMAVKGAAGALTGAAIGAAANYSGDKEAQIAGALTGALVGGAIGIGTGLLTPAFRYYKGRKQAHDEETQRLKEELLKNPKAVNKYLPKEK